MSDSRVITVDKEEILTGSKDKVAKLLQDALEELKSTGNIFPRTLVVSGYDSDPRELSQIPEVKTWFRNLQHEWPYLPVFLAEFSLNQYILSQTENEIVDQDKDHHLYYAVGEDQIRKLFTEIADSAMDYLMQNGFSKFDAKAYISDGLDRVRFSMYAP